MAIDTIVLFDGPQRVHLLPLTFTRAVADIRVGILSLRDKWRYLSGRNPEVLTQTYLQPKYPLNASGRILYVNAAVLPGPALLAELEKLPVNTVLKSGDDLLAIHTDEHFTTLVDLDKTSAYNIVLPTSNFELLRHPWDIFTHNGPQISADIAAMKLEPNPELLSKTNTLVADYNIYVGGNVSCGYSLLNAKAGPIYLGSNSEVMEGCIIRGAFALGEDATLKMGTRIYGDTTIGPHSKVSGEISNSVIFGYSNKAHDGFLGNAVIGEWCNLGAGTNNSNLKNNYGKVRAWDYAVNQAVDTELQFCGLIMGDHAKCAIDTMFNTGTVVGIFANIFSNGFPPKFIPDFSWGEKAEYEFEKALDVAARVMERRDIALTDTDRAILKSVFEATRAYRSS